MDLESVASFAERVVVVRHQVARVHSLQGSLESFASRCVVQEAPPEVVSDAVGISLGDVLHLYVVVRPLYDVEQGCGVGISDADELDHHQEEPRAVRDVVQPLNRRRVLVIVALGDPHDDGGVLPGSVCNDLP